MIFDQLKAVGRVKWKEYLLGFGLNIFCNLKTECKACFKPWKVVFYGTDSLSEVTLKTLNSDRLSFGGCNIVKSLEVVCIKSDCVVRRYAQVNNLTVHTWPYDLPSGAFDVGVVVSFGHLIPRKSIFACKYGIINAHPSLLPRWRGAAPIIHTILNGDNKTGVTITQVSPNKFDVGNIIIQEDFSVPENCTSIVLMDNLGKMAARMVMNTLNDLPHCLKVSYPQPTEGVTYARKIKPENCKINWDQDTSLCIDRKFRAFSGLFDVYTFWKNVKIVILSVTNMADTESAKICTLAPKNVFPGFCYFHKKRKVLYVKSQAGWNGITSVKIPKTGKVSALEFYNGFISKEDPSKCYFT